MKLNKTLTLVALVATGLFTANSLPAQETPKEKPAGEQAGPGGPGARRPAFSIDAIAKQLDLTEEQKTKAKPILDEWQKKMADFRKSSADLSQEDRRTKMKELRDGVTAQLKPILTEEQLAKWEKMGQGMRRQVGPGGPPPAAGEGAKAKEKAPKN